MTDDLEVGAGLASGSSDPRSTNETLDDTFSTKAINLDYAYAKYSGIENTKVIAGKFTRKPVLWQTGYLLWDGDINPEGVSATWSGDVADQDVFVNSGLWILDESSGDTSDPFMYYVQPGITVEAAGNVKVKGALAYY